MHIALVAPAWPPETSFNGIVTYVRWMREGLRQNGCKVSIIAMSLGDGVADDDVHAVPPGSGRRSLLGRAFRRLSGRRPSAYDASTEIAAALRRLHRTRPVDVIEMEESFGWAATVQDATGIPTVVKLHGPALLHLMPGERETAEGQEKIRREGEALRRLPYILSPSRSHLDDTLQHYRLRPRLAAHLVNPLGLPTGAPLWDSSRCEPETVLFVGRFDIVKGADLVIRAFRKVLQSRPSARLVFAGPDNGLLGADGIRVGIADFVASLQDPRLASAFHWRGRLPPQEIADLRVKAACVVVPSRRESQGYTALEAMLQGCPVVCTDASGLRELIDHGVNGLKAKLEDVDDLARNITSLLSDHALAARLGQAARRYVLEFHDPSTVAARAMRFYRQAIAAAKDPLRSAATVADSPSRP